MRFALLCAAVVLFGGARASWSGTLNVPEDFERIAQALAEASPGDTVRVGPGQYVENLVITRPVHLISRAGTEAEVIGDQRREPVIKFEGVEGPCSLQGLKINGALRSTASVEVVDSSPRIVGNEICSTATGILCRQSGGEILGNHFHGNVGSELRLMGSSPLVARNHFDGTAVTAIQIVGKKSAPMIGGSDGQGNVFGPGYKTIIANDTKNPINARFNKWNWSSTVEMKSQEYPSNITAIRDGFDDIGRGKVDYRNWVDEGTGTSPVPGTITLIAIGAVVVVLVLVLTRRALRST